MTDELHEVVALYQQRMTNLYNMHVKQHAFRAGDIVLRRVFENMVNPTTDKFQPNWEGPYMIVRVGAVRLYTLNKLDRTPVPRMQKVMHLKRYFQ